MDPVEPPTSQCFGEEFDGEPCAAPEFFKKVEPEILLVTTDVSSHEEMEPSHNTGEECSATRAPLETSRSSVASNLSVIEAVPAEEVALKAGDSVQARHTVTDQWFHAKIAEARPGATASSIGATETRRSE